MDPIESFFPIPESELRKLSEVEALVSSATGGLARAADQFVQENPWEAIGLAGLAGLVIGIWAGSR